MYNKKLCDFIDVFFSLASVDKKPEDSDKLKVILFNIDNLDTFSAKKKYAERNLKHLSSGSSRVVYLTKDGTVIKLAKNAKGLAQNKEEAAQNNKSKYLNVILSKSKKFNWIETNYLDKITAKEFEKMVGVKFKDFTDCVSYGLKGVSGNKDKEKPSSLKEISKLDIYKDIIKIGIKYDLLPGDLAKISSWACKDNHPVLIDSGLTKKIFNEFYDS